MFKMDMIVLCWICTKFSSDSMLPFYIFIFFVALFLIQYVALKVYKFS